MQCFELTDRGVIAGFQVETHPTPHVNVTSSGEFYFDLDPRLGPLVHKARAACPDDLIRVRNLMIVVKNDNQYMTTCPPQKEALVFISVSAARGGKVFLEASNNRGEFCEKEEIITWFAPFPSLGISILDTPYGRNKPWEDGAQQLELTIVMMKGSSFRIYRSIAPHGVQRVTYVKWSGASLDITRPTRNGVEIEARA